MKKFFEAFFYFYCDFYSDLWDSQMYILYGYNYIDQPHIFISSDVSEIKPPIVYRWMSVNFLSAFLSVCPCVLLMLYSW